MPAIFKMRPKFLIFVFLGALCGCQNESQSQELANAAASREEVTRQCRALWRDSSRAVDFKVNLLPSSFDPTLQAVAEIPMLESTTRVSSNAAIEQLNLEKLLDSLEQEPEIKSKLDSVVRDHPRSAGFTLFDRLCGSQSGAIALGGDNGQSFRLILDQVVGREATSLPGTVSAVEPKTKSACAKNEPVSLVNVPAYKGETASATVVLAPAGALAAKLEPAWMDATVEYREIDVPKEVLPDSGGDCDSQKPGYLLVRSGDVPVGIALNIPKRSPDSLNAFLTDAQVKKAGAIPSAASGAGSSVVQPKNRRQQIESGFESSPRQVSCIDASDSGQKYFPPVILFKSVRTACESYNGSK